MQIRLSGFSQELLHEVGSTVRNLYAGGSDAEERIRDVVDDDYLAALAASVAGSLGGKVGVAPRVFHKKLVGDVLDRVDQFDDFDPRRHYKLTVSDGELNDVERNAASGVVNVDDIEL